MDVAEPYTEEIPSPILNKERLQYSALETFQKDSSWQSTGACNVKNEIYSGYPIDGSIRSALTNSFIDSRDHRDGPIQNEWCKLKSEPFHNLLCGGAPLQAEHKEKSESRLNFFCLYCSKGFAKKQQLQNHIKTHTREKNFRCFVCNKRFVHKQQLTNHEKTHTGRKDFECPFCNKRFILKQQMQIHVKTHTGEKNFKCNMCEKKFITKQQLQNHINSHLGYKPFTCGVCSKNFAHKQQLNRHETRHGRQTHFCAECNLKFKANKVLLAHISNVHGAYNNL